MESNASRLLQQAQANLVALLPARFELGQPAVKGPGPFDGPDGLWELREQNTGYGLILVEAKRSFGPRDAIRMRERLTAPMLRLMREPTVLVIAEWLSPRTRALLEEGGYSYLDLTGNVRFQMDRPAVFIRLQGSDRDPRPRRPHSLVRLQGAKARRLVRLLVEARPPHRPTSLAEAGGLTAGYVSKTLTTLDDLGLIERDRRGLVEDVDWPGLLLAGAEHYDLLRNNVTSIFVSPDGASALYARIKAATSAPKGLITGSFAAVEVAPIVAPAQLVVYVRDPQEFRRFGRLLPTEQGADVVLLQPEDPAQLSGDREVDGLRHVGLSQLVLDCLGGNGRLPEEGQAVLDWMKAHEKAWRRAELPLLAG